MKVIVTTKIMFHLMKLNTIVMLQLQKVIDIENYVCESVKKAISLFNADI